MPNKEEKLQSIHALLLHDYNEFCFIPLMTIFGAHEGWKYTNVKQTRGLLWARLWCLPETEQEETNFCVKQILAKIEILTSRTSESRTELRSATMMYVLH